jgi:hypothetical protein
MICELKKISKTAKEISLVHNINAAVVLIFIKLMAYGYSGTRSCRPESRSPPESFRTHLLIVL